jgi:hypothetical protein
MALFHWRRLRSATDEVFVTSRGKAPPEFRGNELEPRPARPSQ